MLKEVVAAVIHQSLSGKIKEEYTENFNPLKCNHVFAPEKIQFQPPSADMIILTCLKESVLENVLLIIKAF